MQYKKLLQLAYKNLQRTKLRSFLTGSTVIIGISSLFLILSLNSGIQNALFKNAEKKNPLNQIRVHAPASDNIISSLIGTVKGTEITDQTIATIEKLPNVDQVLAENTYNKPSSVEVSIFGQTLQTDSMIFGVPHEFIDQTISTPTNWKKNNNLYPAIISRRLLDIYNLSVAQPQGIPQITEEMIIGQELDIFLGYSSFFAPFSEKAKAPKIKAQVAGLSDKTSLIGVTLPIETIKELNKQLDPTTTDEYVNLYVLVDSPQNVETVASKIETELKLETQYLQKTYNQIQTNIIYLTIGLSIISIIILSVAALSIANSFFANISERVNEIGILRSIGATKSNIQTLFLSEATILGFINGILGVLIALILIPIIDHLALSALPDVTNKPQTLFNIETYLIVIMPLFSIFFSTISAFIPARAAANLNTIKALNT